MVSHGKGDPRPLTDAEASYLDYLLRRHRGELTEGEAVPDEIAGLREELRPPTSWSPSDSFADKLVERYGVDPDSEFFIGADAPTLDEDGDHSSHERYTRGREIARGGMGVIYEAWDRDIDRPLAMKIILDRNRATDALLVNRFVREAKITGQLDHPGVVPVHDIGVDEHGQIYFTMRLVRGRDLEQVFALGRDNHGGWNRTRALEVLLKVCDTVAFAHDRGVIHRDLKPSNVMVGDFGEVYVMDWGLAKTVDEENEPESSSPVDGIAVDGIDAELDEDPDDLTLVGAVMGTPAFMPPEQARGDHHAVDRRSDVYAIGAMLYTLLTGELPYRDSGGKEDSEVEGSTILERVRSGPPTPVLARNAQAPTALVEICERAMAREPDRRHVDASELAIALREYLAAEERAAEEAAEAIREKSKAEAVAEFMTELFDLSSPSKEHLARVSAVDVLARGAQRLNDGFHDQPVTRVTLLHTLGDLYRKLGMAREAAPLLDEAIQLRRSIFGAVDAGLATNLDHLAATLETFGEYERAEACYREALAIRRQLFGERHVVVAESLGNLGPLLVTLARFDEAETILREAAALRTELFGSEHPAVAAVVHELGFLKRRTGRLEEAEELYRHALDLRRRAAQPEPLEIATTLNNLGVVLVATGRFTEAEPVYREALAIRLDTLGRSHPDTAFSLNNLAALLYQRGEYPEAIELLTEACAVRRELIGSPSEDDDTPEIANCSYNLAGCYAAIGKLEEAERLSRHVVDVYERYLGAEHPQAAQARAALGMVLGSTGEYDEATPLLREAIDAHPGHPRVGDFWLWRAEVELARGEVRRAGRAVDRAEATFRKRLTDDHPRWDDIERMRIELELTDLEASDAAKRLRACRARMLARRGTGYSGVARIDERLSSLE